MIAATPRTDALEPFHGSAMESKLANLARTLERENAELWAALENLADDRAVYAPELQAIARSALAGPVRL